MREQKVHPGPDWEPELVGFNLFLTLKTLASQTFMYVQVT